VKRKKKDSKKGAASQYQREGREVEGENKNLLKDERDREGS